MTAAVLSAVAFQLNVLCGIDAGTDDASEEFSVSHGWVSASDSRSSLAGADTQRRDVSIFVLHVFIAVSVIVVISSWGNFWHLRVSDAFFPIIVKMPYYRGLAYLNWCCLVTVQISLSPWICQIDFNLLRFAKSSGSIHVCYINKHGFCDRKRIRFDGILFTPLFWHFLVTVPPFLYCWRVWQLKLVRMQFTYVCCVIIIMYY